MSDVFISYSRRNSVFARRLIERLTLANKDAWVDWEGIPLTSPNWWGDIKAGIEGADSFVFIISPDSMASVVCNMELDYALERQKRIIPVVHLEVVTKEAFASIADFQPDQAMSERLAGKDPLQIARDNWQQISHINWVFFRETDDFDQAFTRLVTTVETDLPYVKAHTRLLTRALEWQRAGQRADLLLFGGEIDAAEAWLRQAEGYVAKAQARSGSEKFDVVNPLPEAVQRDYIRASRKAQQRRRTLAGSGVLIATLAFVFAIVAALIGVQANENANLAATRESDAVTSVAQANEQLTAVPPTLTEVGGQVATAEEQVVQAGTQVANANAQSTLAIAEANSAATRESAANRDQAAAEAAVATATQQLFQAQGTATQIPPTLTQAAVIQEIVFNFSNTLLQQSGNPSQQIAAMDRLVEQYPEEALAYLSRGLVNREQGSFEAAIADFDDAIRLDPELAEAYNGRGAIYYDLEQYEAAIADFDEAIRLDPELAEAYVGRGIAYANLEQYEAAIADYDEAIRLDPDGAVAYYNRGIAYYSLEQYEAAIADYDEALRLDPDYALAYNNRGAAYAGLEQYEAAIADYDEAIRLDPDDALAYVGRGNAYFDLEQYEAAIADYDEALRLDPDYALAYNNRGSAYGGLSQYEAAIADYTRAIDLNPDDAVAYINRGIAYRALEQYEAAIADYTEALRLDPDYAVAYINRGIAYYFKAQGSVTRRDDLTQALSDWRRAEQLGLELPQVILEEMAVIEAELEGSARPTPRP